jgi:hypothetical protein
MIQILFILLLKIENILMLNRFILNFNYILASFFEFTKFNFSVNNEG